MDNIYLIFNLDYDYEMSEIEEQEILTEFGY